MHLASDQSRTGNSWFPSPSYYPLNHAPVSFFSEALFINGAQSHKNTNQKSFLGLVKYL